MIRDHPSSSAPPWVVGVAVLPLLIFAVLSAMVRARRGEGRPTAAGEVVLEYGRFLKALPAIFVVLWAVLLVGIAITEPPKADDAPIFLGIVAGVVALLVPLAMETRGVAHRLPPRASSGYPPGRRP